MKKNKLYFQVTLNYTINSLNSIPFNNVFVKIKVTSCLGSGELVNKKRLKTVCYKMHNYGWNNKASKLRGFSSTSWTNTTRLCVDSSFWLHKMADRVSSQSKRKTHNFEACLCGSLYSAFKTSFKPYRFHNKRFQMLLMDQLDRSKATCPFNGNKIYWFEASNSFK